MEDGRDRAQRSNPGADRTPESVRDILARNASNGARTPPPRRRRAAAEPDDAPDPAGRAGHPRTPAFAAPAVGQPLASRTGRGSMGAAPQVGPRPDRAPSGYRAPLPGPDGRRVGPTPAATDDVFFPTPGRRPEPSSDRSVTAPARPPRPAGPPARPPKPAGRAIIPGTVADQPADRPGRRSTKDPRAARIDDTLTRITAAHAGLTMPRPDQVEDEPAAPPTFRKRRTWLKLLVGALSLAIFGTTGFGWAAKGWLESGVTRVAALDPTSDLIVDAEAQAGDRNILIVASARAGGSATTPTVAVAHRAAGADTTTTVLAFPSNLVVSRPPCERWDPSSRSYSDEVLPAAARSPLSLAFDVGGPRCVTRIVQQLSGIAVTGFVGVDIDGLGSVATALGGLDTCVPRPVEDATLGPVVPTAGRSTLDGRQAADYAAAAAVAGEPPTGRARIERQQLLLAGALEQSIGGPGLLDVARLGQLRLALGQALSSDEVGLDETLTLARSLRNLEADGVAFAAVPTTGDPLGGGELVLRDVEASALFTAVRTRAPLPAQAGPDSTGAPTPAQLKVAVLNGTKRTGLAAKVAQTLGSLGFGVGEVGTAEQVTEQTLIRFSPDQASAAALLASTVPSATSVPDPGTSGVLQLVIGSSYDDVLTPPAAPAAQGTGAAGTEPAPVSCG